MLKVKQQQDAEIAKVRLVEILLPAPDEQSTKSGHATMPLLVVMGQAPEACEEMAKEARALGFELRFSSSVCQSTEFLSGTSLGCILLTAPTLDAGTIKTLRAVRAVNGQTPIVLVVTQVEPEAALDVMQEGCIEIIRSTDTSERRRAALVRAIAFEKRRAAREASMCEIESRLALLTDREFGVLRLMLAGLGNKQIAYTLGLSVKTIECHRARVLTKLYADNIAAYAHRLLCALA